ncbi:MAG TPA: ATP-binding cassette domain-containing protein [Thermoanaerobacterales bacterium]|nr:ATP-binding cassette domain-containing protein [Thermoanaerobacterales bacterium]
MIRLEDISVKAVNGDSEIDILDNISVSFEEGKFYCITGPNGGGKTTFAKVIMGIIKPSSGKLYFNEKDITESDITERAKLGIGYAFQYPPKFKGLRVRDILKIAAGANGDMEHINRSLTNLGLNPEEYLDREIDGSLSGGEMKRIEIASVLLKQPNVIIFDEPEAGVDLWSFDELINVIKENHNKNGGITIVISHQERLLSTADEIVVICNGGVQKIGPAHKILPQIKSDICCKFRDVCRGDEDAECDR